MLGKFYADELLQVQLKCVFVSYWQLKHRACVGSVTERLQEVRLEHVAVLLGWHVLYTVHGKSFEGENFRGWTQNPLFAGKHSR